jgi:hypothetical protein
MDGAENHPYTGTTQIKRKPENVIIVYEVQEMLFFGGGRRRGLYFHDFQIGSYGKAIHQ